MESSQEDKVRQPFDFKIKALKRQLALGGMSKHDINKTVALYKHKVYDKVTEVKAKMEAELEAKLKKREDATQRLEGVSNASNK